MIRFQIGVEDLADTRFAVSPLAETVCSLWALRDPHLHTVHRPWVGPALDALDPADARLLLSLVGDRRALPDFLTPRPSTPAPAFEDELAVVRATRPHIARRDLLATHAPAPPPEALRDAVAGDDGAVRGLLEAIAGALRRHWRAALAPWWPRMRLVLEADVTYRARRLATGGARLLFADLHTNLRWDDGHLHVEEMIGRHDVAAAGRGVLLVPSLFASKPVPPLDPHESPWLIYPSRGVATLWSPAEAGAATALVSLLGGSRARLLSLLDEPLPTIELARRLGVTPSAVSQHLRVLHATRLVARARDGRHVLYRRSALGDELVAT